MEISERDRQINELLDREAIRELPVRYCHCVRTRNLAAMLNLFAEDGCLEMPKGVATSSRDGGVWSGQAALSEVFRAGFERTDPWPFVHNHIVDLQDGRHATGVVYAEVRTAGENLRVVQIVVYDDEYVKVDGRWKFRRRRMNGTPIPA